MSSERKFISMGSNLKRRGNKQNKNPQTKFVLPYFSVDINSIDNKSLGQWDRWDYESEWAEGATKEPIYNWTDSSVSNQYMGIIPHHKF